MLISNQKIVPTVLTPLYLTENPPLEGQLTILWVKKIKYLHRNTAMNVIAVSSLRKKIRSIKILSPKYKIRYRLTAPNFKGLLP